MLETKQFTRTPRKNDRILIRSLFPTDLPISFRHEGVEMVSKGVLHSLSPGGLFVKAFKAPTVGTNVAVVFRLYGRQIQCQGRVIYHNARSSDLVTPGFGIKFTRMLSDDFRIIQGAIREFLVSVNPFQFTK